MNFPTKRGAAIPIPPVRHTTKTDTVFRWKAAGKQSEVMKAVRIELVGRPDFAGKMLSYADRRIWDAANGHVTPGNANKWREWNMARHITRVCSELATMSGLWFVDEVEYDEPEEINIFADS
ncbi:beta family protein [Roseovarius nanhaiticus]|uniref:beta family protein n=1 Tax=Roseovarius nanhaiticus TaxID=573024 RepID=UPI0024924DE5|nr:hypothetical protein [Roseovarius nanhaiticus]